MAFGTRRAITPALQYIHYYSYYRSPDSHYSIVHVSDFRPRVVTPPLPRLNIVAFHNASITPRLSRCRGYPIDIHPALTRYDDSFRGAPVGNLTPPLQRVHARTHAPRPLFCQCLSLPSET